MDERVSAAGIQAHFQYALVQNFHQFLAKLRLLSMVFTNSIYITHKRLISHIDTGLKKRYTEKEVVTAVIRSVQTGLQYEATWRVKWVNSTTTA